jgi:predicted metalloprotease with PDZ domain
MRIPPSFVEDEPLSYGPVSGPRARTVDTAQRKHIARLDGTLGVGPYTIVDPVFEADDTERSAIIGSGIFKNFTVTFDQGATPGHVRFARDGSDPIITPARRILGFDLDLQDGTFTVGDVVDGSPAAASGLEVGANVISIDGRPIESMHGTPAWGDLVGQARVRLGIRTPEGETREITVAVYEIIPAS